MFRSNSWFKHLLMATWAIAAVLAHDSVFGATKSSPDAVIYSGTYPGWPWIDKTPDGTLLTVWREGNQHMYSSGGKIMMSKSTDKGKTWSTATTILDAPEIDDRNVAITALSNSDWMLSYNTYTSNDVSRTMVTRTSDGGATWSDAKHVNSTLDARTRASVVKLSSGKLVLPYYENSPTPRALAGISNDDGNTWSTVSVPNTSGFAGDEWSFMELSDHKLVGMIRNSASGGDGSLWVTTSANEGLSWSTPLKTNLRDTSLINGPPQIFMQNGKPWVLYDDTRKVSVACATTSDANFVTWEVSSRIPAYQYHADGSPIADGGYPCSVALDGDQRYVVDYVIDGNGNNINGYLITVPEPSSFAVLGILFGTLSLWKVTHIRRT
jgi:sialidase-1